MLVGGGRGLASTRETKSETLEGLQSAKLTATSIECLCAPRTMVYLIHFKYFLLWPRRWVVCDCAALSIRLATGQSQALLSDARHDAKCFGVDGYNWPALNCFRLERRSEYVNASRTNARLLIHFHFSSWPNWNVLIGGRLDARFPRPTWLGAFSRVSLHKSHIKMASACSNRIYFHIFWPHTGHWPVPLPVKLTNAFRMAVGRCALLDISKCRNKTPATAREGRRTNMCVIVAHVRTIKLSLAMK